MAKVILDKNTKYYENKDYNDQFVDVMNGEGGSTSGIFVGYVTNGGSMPTTRQDGTPLKDEDYVRPLATSSFPFNIGTCTFENRLSRAIYSASVGVWIVDVGLIQNTSETPLKSSSESFSGNKSYQNEVNLEVVDELKKTIKQYKVLPTNCSLYTDTIAFYVGASTTEYEQNQYYKCNGNSWVKFNIIPVKTIQVSNLGDDLASKIYQVEVDSSNPDVLNLHSLI